MGWDAIANPLYGVIRNVLYNSGGRFSFDDSKVIDLKENSRGRDVLRGAFPLKTKKPAQGGLFVGKSLLSSGLRLFVHPVGPSERTQIIEPHAIFPEHFVRPLGGHLPYIEGVADHEVVDGVGAAEVEAECLQGP